MTIETNQNIKILQKVSISSKGADKTAWKEQAGLHLFVCMQENQVFLQKRVNIILKK